MASLDVITTQLEHDWEVSAETIPGEDRFQHCQITVVAGDVVGMVSYHQALLRAGVDVSYYALIEKHAR